jgi:hypothetical protein
MGKTGKAKTSTAKRALPYLQTLLENKYLQAQLREAAIGLRQAYGRVARKRAQATEDKRLYGNLGRAATSIRNAWLALRKPPPAPKRRGRKMLIIALAGCGAALLTRLGRHQQDSETTPDPTAPNAAATSTGDGSPQAETATSS